MGFGTALDDFGAGHAGLSLLARFQPDIIKLDMDLIRGLEPSLPRRIIIDGVARMCRQLEITLIAEGVERRRSWTRFEQSESVISRAISSPTRGSSPSGDLPAPPRFEACLAG